MGDCWLFRDPQKQYNGDVIQQAYFSHYLLNVSPWSSVVLWRQIYVFGPTISRLFRAFLPHVSHRAHIPIACVVWVERNPLIAAEAATIVGYMRTYITRVCVCVCIPSFSLHFHAPFSASLSAVCCSFPAFNNDDDEANNTSDHWCNSPPFPLPSMNLCLLGVDVARRVKENIQFILALWDYFFSLPRLTKCKAWSGSNREDAFRLSNERTLHFAPSSSSSFPASRNRYVFICLLIADHLIAFISCKHRNTGNWCGCCISLSSQLRH